MFAGWTPPTGEISYNGIVFSGATNVTVDVAPQYDDSGRVVLYSRHTFQVTATVKASAGSSTDASMEGIRTRLQSPGKRFSFSQKGFGNFVVNGYGGLQDLEFGPKPRMLRWQPLGDSNACRVVWSVEVCVPRCPMFPTSGPMELTWKIDWSYDRAGLCSRSCQGKLRIISYQKNGFASDSADNYRNLLFVYPVLGFERAQSYSLSEDRQTLTFNCVDTEIASNLPYPYGVHDAKGNHSVVARRGNITNQSLSMSINMIRGYDERLGWNIFQSFTQKYLADQSRVSRSTPIFNQLSISEDIWGTGTSQFSLEWETSNTLQYLVDQTGLWRYKYEINTPFMRNDWSFWGASVAHGPYAVRSYTGLGYFQKDIVIDLCEMNISPQSVNGGSTGSTGSVPPGPASSGSNGPVDNDQMIPSAEQSWTVFDVHVMPRVIHNISHVGLAGKTQLASESEWKSSEYRPFAMRTANQTPKTSIVYNGASTHEVVLWGRLKRVYHPITRPRLVAFGGNTMYEKRAYFDMSSEPSSFGQPVNVMTFAVVYGMLDAGAAAAPIPNFLTER